jgi:hypothetical protein
MFPIICLSQIGTIKIFTELSPVKVYLDEEFKGVDVKVLDSVQIGSHYVKVTKDEVIIYGELVNVSPGAVTTILIKNDKEVQTKVLDAKFKEQEEYKLKRIEILLSTNYSTETSGKSVSTYYPGYYVGTVSTNTASNSQTTAYTDWFIVQGGANRISDVEFAKLTNNTNALAKYEADKANLNKEIKTINVATTVTTIMSLGFVTGGFVALKRDNLKGGAAFMVLAAIFLYPISAPHNDEKNIRANYKWQSHYMTAEEALRSAQKYNQELKKKLGLPENYEPK